MGVNLVNTADGKELINLTNDTVSEANLLSGETAHNAAGDRITGKAVYVNPNLLINRDFSINQRGKTEYSGAGYTVDGWKKGSSNTLEVNNDGSVTITKEREGTHVFANFCDVLTADNSSGKTVTFSFFVLEYSGSVKYTVAAQSETSAITLFTGYIDKTGIISCTVTLPIDTDFSYVTVQPAVPLNIGDYAKVKQAKLELGSFQTLARQDDDGNWVIIDPPPNPAVELLKCQRYFERVQIPVNNRLTAYMFTDTSSCSYNIEYKPKRTVPTIVKPEYNGRFVEQYNQRVVVLTSFDIESLTTTNVSIHAAFAAALDSKSVGWVDSLGYVDVSAEL